MTGGGNNSEEEISGEEVGETDAVAPTLLRPKKKNTPPLNRSKSTNSRTRSDDAEAVKFLQEAFNEADEDNSGTLDMLEAMAMISEMVHLRQLQIRETQSRENVKVALFLLLPLIVIGSFIFKALEEEGKLTTLDAFYFSLISVSTVGLGDLVPTKGPSRYFWYFYMTLTLGLVASMIQQAGKVISSAGVRAEMMARKAAYKAAAEENMNSLTSSFLFVKRGEKQVPPPPPAGSGGGGGEEVSRAESGAMSDTGDGF